MLLPVQSHLAPSGLFDRKDAFGTDALVMRVSHCFVLGRHASRELVSLLRAGKSAHNCHAA